ncbi:hypothetical protein SETIT_2G245900v2 [Setaria italica]|uniref:25S rRNA (uridine-N(3))-methyltransferase BMT5-like domain-containing protein n=1 Tax=Setaria italica TaxID=4555 RepID=A0A368Q2W9_SETIT|nr:uncharacterized protein LOC101775743 [Setaria italica]RCV12144.1 hypothetical protein SETIT_2G245900v2 [Setaria italica]
MAVGVASPAVGNAAAGDGGEAAPAEGVPGMGVEAKGKAVLVEGAPPAIAVEGNDAEEEEDEEDKEEAADAEEGSEDDDEEGEKWLGCYSSTQSILLVGEGNFSFSLALATAFGSGANLVATSLDTDEALKKMYSRAESNIMNLKRLGATVLHGIDVQKMKFHTDLKNRRFDCIVYNFPHAGFKGKEYEAHMINLHKKLVRGYFCNARHLLRPCGEIHVSHKSGASYDKWDLEQIAAKFSLILVEKVGFQKAQYPGYNQKKGDGPMCDKSFPLGTCFTFRFRIGDLKKRKKQNRRRAGLVSSIGGSTRPSHPPPPVEALPGLDFPPPANTENMPMTLLPHVDVQRQPSGFALNFSSIPRAPCFHPLAPVCPVLSMPGRLNALGTTAGIPPPMGRITSTTLLTPQGQRIIAKPLVRTTDCCFAWEYKGSLRREFEMLRQVMPGSTNLTYSAFLEHRHRESVRRQEWLRRMIANSCQ